jgi:hypothetical protein
MILWVASYPKSGNTWLRALLSSYYYSENGIFDPKLLSKIENFPQKKFFKNFNYDRSTVTDTSNFWIKAQEIINKDRKLKFFKTHNILGKLNNNYFTDIKNTIGGIYIVRDPRNIITSLKNHYEMNDNDALRFMLSEKKYIYDYHAKNDYSDFQLISSWENNYKSWKDQKIIPVKFIRYEDLHAKTYEVFKNIVEFINVTCKNNIKFNKNKAKKAIYSSSFDNLKNIENNKGFSESVLSKMGTKKISFFYLGPKNNWKNIFDENYQNKLNLAFKANLKELNYL